MESPTAPPMPMAPKPGGPPPGKEAFKELMTYIIIAGLSILALAFLFVIPSIYLSLTSGGITKGWILTENPPKNQNGGSNENVSSKKPRSSSALYVIFRRFYNLTLLRVIPVFNITIGQFFVLIILLVIFAFGLVYKNLDAPEMNFQRPGKIAILFLPLIFILAMKNTPLSIFGKGYERLNFIHRFLGRLMLIAAWAHGLLFVRIKLVNNKPIVFQGVPLRGLIALAGITLLALTSIKPFRARFYQTFLFFHILGYNVFLVALWTHTPASRPYIFAAVLTLGLDGIMVFFKSRFRTAIFKSVPGGSTRIEVNGIAGGWRAGQHVYLRVLKGRYIFEKHPFTICNAPSGKPVTGNHNLVLVAKAVGDFTKNLHLSGLNQDLPIQLQDTKDSSDKASIFSGSEHHSMNLESGSRGNRFRIIVEGPYGTSYTDLTQYETVLLVAGGSGFSYCAATIEAIVGSARLKKSRTRTIYLTWALEDLGLIQGYAVALNACLSMAQQVGLQVVMKIHLTKSGQPTRTDFNPIIQSQLMTGRPQFPSLLREVLQSSCVANDLRGSKRGGGVGVGVCGPKPLVTSLRNSIANADSTMASKAGGITLHSEMFDW